MRYAKVILCMAFILVLAAGCGVSEMEPGPKREKIAYREYTVKAPGEMKLLTQGDTGNVEVFAWDRNEFKIEASQRVRGVFAEERLKELVKDFRLDVKADNGAVYVKASYSGPVGNPLDRGTDLKIFTPRRRLLQMNVKWDAGRVKVYDDLDCSLQADLGLVDLDINRIKGRLEVQGDTGNITVSGGVLEKGSFVRMNMGNIRIKGECEEDGDYLFDTGVGNVDVWMPEDLRVCFESTGTVETNEFQQEDAAAKVRVRSGMGRISIRKYE